MMRYYWLKPKPKMRAWWFVCAVKPSMERKFHSEIAHAGIYGYSPVETDHKIVRGQIIIVHNRFLKGYMFIHGSHLKQFLDKRDWKGFINIFSNNDEFCRVDDRIVQELIRRQLANEFDKRAHSAIRVGDLVYFEDVELGKIWPDFQFPVLGIQRKNAIISHGNQEVKIPLSKLRKVTL